MLSIPKLLVIVLVLGAIYYLFFRKPKKVEKNDESNQTKKPKNSDGEIMVECAKCGTYISAKEAIIKDGRYYCSKECAA